MYNSLSRCRGILVGTGAHDREVASESRHGSAVDFLRRHERECAQAARGTKKQGASFQALVFDRATDPRNLKLALDHLAAAGEAPGPDGLRPRDLYPEQRWALARELSSAIRSGKYKPGKDRLARIPKQGGNGYRELKIQNVCDRAVQRGVLQIVQPYLDPRFAETSFGFRPLKERAHALRCAESSTVSSRLRIWSVDDIANAFDDVPHSRLVEVLRLHLSNPRILSLIETIVENENHRGLRQGGALSPFLLNLYLDHVLDRPFQKKQPATPLIRYADDMLILGRDREQVEEARRALERRLSSAGMKLQTSKSRSADLESGETIEWLGYMVGLGDQRLHVRIAESSWEQMDRGLAKLHEGLEAPWRALEAIGGWIDQLGPCRVSGRVDEVAKRISRLAHRYAFEELPDASELKVRWISANERWKRLREEHGGREVTEALGGSA